jgi:class 3 adenylate cyclase
VIFTSLPGPPEVECVALGPNGLIEGMEKGSAWFDLTTNSPTLVRRLGAMALTGTVCVSQSIYDQTRAQPEFFFADRGTHRVKNIP